MAITPLQVTQQVGLQILDGQIILFDSKVMKNTNGSQYIQSFGDKVVIPAGTLDLQLDTETVTRIQLLFVKSDQQLLLKIVPQGSVLGDVKGLTLAGSDLPSLLSLDNVNALYISNTGADPASLTFYGAGTVY